MSSNIDTSTWIFMAKHYDVANLSKDLASFVFCAIRISTTLMILPVFGRNIIPNLAKATFFGSLCLVSYPIIRADVPANIELLHMFVIAIKEIIVGLCMGFLIAAPSGAMRSIGALLDNARGASTPGSNDPISGATVGAIEAIMQQIFVVFFFFSGAHLLLFAMLFESFRLWPVFSWFPSMTQEGFHWALAAFDYFMKLVVVFAAPILVPMFLIDVGLAFMSRFLPQLQVFLIAMPLKAGIAIFGLIVYMALLLSFVGQEFYKIPDEIWSVMHFIHEKP